MRGALFAGLRRTGPSTTAILSTFEPVVTTALATLNLGESLTLVQVLGGVLVLSSVAILQIRPARTNHRARHHIAAIAATGMMSGPSPK